MTTVRLPIELEQKLERFSKINHTSKTDIIKKALENFFSREETQQDSYEIGEHYFGKHGSGDGSLSATYKSKLKNKLKDKFNAQTDSLYHHTAGHR